MFDIHSHILPAVDDGAENIEESLELLKLMKADGITHVMATPHFYPDETSLEEYTASIATAYNKLKSLTENTELPKIYLGCELLYFDSLGYSSSLGKLCLNESNFLLLELTDHCINDKLFDNISTLMDKTGIIPIIAHIERYYKAKNYKRLVNFVLERRIPIQLNAASFFIHAYKRTLKKWLMTNAVIVLGSDAHSTDTRPPRLNDALLYIEKKYGSTLKERLIKNSELFMKKIIK